MDNETIAALATPAGTSGIGIIRISGNRSVSIVEPIFRTAHNTDTPQEKPLRHLASRHLKYGFIVDPLTRNVVDEVMVVVMRAPNSYTREDVVEIQSHSGHVIMATILKMVLEQGARLAEPGEFTKRAFLNGRIDLTQAEAIADVISARSESSLQVATTHLAGHMREAVNDLLEILGNIQVELEASIEFPDEVGDGPEMNTIKKVVQSKVMAPIQALIDQYDDGHFLRDGIRIGIVGRPNVGKSSLLNRILRKDKAIVTPTPGTTRDLIEDQICIEGVPILIADTAGLRPSTDPIELIGMERAQQRIDTSDIILLVVDGSQPFTQDDMAVYERVKQQRYILCVNKIDLMKEKEKQAASDFPGLTSAVHICAKTGGGIDGLKLAIKDRCLNEVKIEPGRSIVPNQRQKMALEMAADHLKQAIRGLEEGITEELIISDFELVKSYLGQIIGLKIDGDILDDIFNRFCIGK